MENNSDYREYVESQQVMEASNSEIVEGEVRPNRKAYDIENKSLTSGIMEMRSGQNQSIEALTVAVKHSEQVSLVADVAEDNKLLQEPAKRDGGDEEGNSGKVLGSEEIEVKNTFAARESQKAAANNKHPEQRRPAPRQIENYPE